MSVATASRCARMIVILLALVGSIAARSVADSPGQWIAVTPPAFSAALTPLVEHRLTHGFKVVVLETTNALNRQQLQDCDGAPLQARLKELCRSYPGPSYVLLAGIFGMAGGTNWDNVAPSLRGAVERMKGRASDLGYGLPDADGVPTVAVGRFLARTPDELEAMIRKTLDFERDPDPAPWQQRLLLLLGNPGGGPLAEMFVGQSLSKDLAVLHPSWKVRTLFNVSSSPYYLPRPQDRETALGYLQEGQLFTVYLGHSAASGLGLDGKFLSRADWRKLDVPRGAGPFFTCGCFACQSSGDDPGYALVALRNPSGPVAVIGARGESYSVAGELAVEGLLNCLKHPPFPARLADYWLAIQAGLARGKMDSMTFSLLDMADGTQGKVPLATQRLEHLEMWTLLGDPALRLPVAPLDISLSVTDLVVARKTFSVSGELPDALDGATVRLDLERPLNSTPSDLEKVPSNTSDPEARERAFVANHRRANAFVLAATEAKASGKRFVASLEPPARLPWTNVIIRATATISNRTAFGVIGVPSQSTDGTGN